MEDRKMDKRIVNILAVITIFVGCIGIASAMTPDKPLANPIPAMVDSSKIQPPADPMSVGPMVAPKPTAPRPMTPMVAVMAKPAKPVPIAPMVATPKPTEPKATPTKDPWWKVLLGNLVQAALLFVLAILMMLGRFAVQWFAKKLKITNAEQIQKMNELYNAAVVMGVNFANQMAHKLKDDPDAAGKRINWASEMITKLIKDYGLPEKSADWIKHQIEAKLGETERKISGLAFVSSESDKN
jgi:hypothetical protein